MFIFHSLWNMMEQGDIFFVLIHCYGGLPRATTCVASVLTNDSIYSVIKLLHSRGNCADHVFLENTSSLFCLKTVLNRKCGGIFTH